MSSSVSIWLREFSEAFSPIATAGERIPPLDSLDVVACAVLGNVGVSGWSVNGEPSTIRCLVTITSLNAVVGSTVTGDITGVVGAKGSSGAKACRSWK